MSENTCILSAIIQDKCVPIIIIHVSINNSYIMIFISVST